MDTEIKSPMTGDYEKKQDIDRITEVTIVLILGIVGFMIALLTDVEYNQGRLKFIGILYTIITLISFFIPKAIEKYLSNDRQLEGAILEVNTEIGYILSVVISISVVVIGIYFINKKNKKFDSNIAIK